MTLLRTVTGLVAAVGLLKLVSVGTWWQVTTVEASPRERAHDDAACGSGERGFRELLQAVQAHSRDLVKRDGELKAREAGLVTMRKAVAGEIARLEAVAKTLGIAGPGTPGVAVTRVYETMRPEEAAPILDRLDDATLRAVLGRMRERPLGALLAAMSPERAVTVTKALAGVRPSEPAPTGR